MKLEIVLSPGVDAGGVVGAGVEEDNRALGDLFDVLAGAGEVEAASVLVVVTVAGDLHA